MLEANIPKPPSRHSGAGLQRLLRAMCVALVLGYGLFVIHAYRDGFARAARGESPLFTDFTTFYGASMVLKDLPVEFVYHPQVIAEANRRAGNAAYDGRLTPAQTEGIVGRFMYPPTFIVAALPWAWLPYLPALTLWLAVTALPYLWLAIRLFAGSPWAVPAALAFPACVYNAMFGQTGFLLAGLIGLGLLHLHARPLLAGFLIGLASVKPHLGVLIPVALLAGGHWRATAAATTTVLAMVLATIVVFGLEPWYAFIGTSLVHVTGFEHGAFAWRTMISGLSAAVTLGMSLDAAWWLQGGLSALVAATVALTWWRRPADTSAQWRQAAVLCAAIPLATPMIYQYDLVIVGVALLFLAPDAIRHGASRIELALLAAVLTVLLLLKPLGAVPGVPLGVAALLAVFGVALRRAWQRPPTAAREGLNKRRSSGLSLRSRF